MGRGQGEGLRSACEWQFRLQERGWRWGLMWALWTLVGLSFATQFHFASAQFGYPVSWRRALAVALADWYVFAVLSVPTLWLARRLPLEGGQFWRSLTLHWVGSGVFSLVYMVLRAWIGQVQSDGPITFGAVFNPLVIRTFHFNVLVYWVIVGLSSGWHYYQRFREREWRAAELERRLAEARLQALQMQLNPHFLFNTLNAIAALMHQDVAAADRVVVRLSEMLRMALDSSSTQEVPLRQELEFLSRYLDIETLRFGDRLEVSREIPPETLEALVPNLILQPLVENSIRHGIQPRTGPGCIQLLARRDGATLRLSVRDNGAGSPTPLPSREGIGLTNSRARLHQLYGERQSLRLTPGADGGLTVEIELPYHTRALES